MQWQKIKTAPTDGTEFVALTAAGRVVQCYWHPVPVEGSDGRETWGWAATDDFYPDCWTHGMCWAVNAYGERSDTPVMWIPLPDDDAWEAARDAIMDETKAMEEGDE